MTVESPKCAKCAGPTAGYKCAICGDEAHHHVPEHKHGEPESDRYVMHKCEACDEAEVFCACEAKQ